MSKSQKFGTTNQIGLSFLKIGNLIIAALFLAACSTDDQILHPNPDGTTNKIEVKIVGDGSGIVGAILSLDASESKDGNGGQLAYMWSLSSRPAGSTLDIVGAHSPMLTFIPDKAGLYIVELTVRSGVFSKSLQKHVNVSQSIVINPGNPIIIDNNIQNELRLINHLQSLHEPDYIIKGEIHVYDHLFIENGVTLAFEEGAALIIENPGSLMAIGMGRNIVFTGMEQRPGYWKGIFINSHHSFNELDNVIIEYAGGGLVSRFDFAANLGIMKTGQGILKLKNSIIRHSAAYGLAVEPGARLSGSSFNNVYISNAKPLVIAAAQLHNLDGLSYYPDNALGQIDVIGTQIYEPQNIHWIPAMMCYHCDENKPELVLPYRVMGEIGLASELTIHRGTVLEFEQDGSFKVTGGSGALRTVGNPAMQVVMKAAPNATWKGIAVSSKSIAGTELNHTFISDAGYGLQDGFSYATSILADNTQGVKLTVKNTTIKNSGGYGLFVGYSAELKGYEANQFIENTFAPVALYANHVNMLDGKKSSYRNNGMNNNIEIWPSGLNSANKAEHFWRALPDGTSYFISTGMNVQTGLRMEAGVRLVMGSQARILVGTNGYLNAQGTSEARISFEGLQKASGYWQGVLFQSGSEFNMLNFVDISHAGGYELPNMFERAAVAIDGRFGAGVTIKNSIITDVSGYGIYLYGDATVNEDVETANTFDRLEKGAVKR